MRMWLEDQKDEMIHSARGLARGGRETLYIVRCDIGYWIGSRWQAEGIDPRYCRIVALVNSRGDVSWGDRTQEIVPPEEKPARKPVRATTSGDTVLQTVTLGSTTYEVFENLDNAGCRDMTRPYVLRPISGPSKLLVYAFRDCGLKTFGPMGEHYRHALHARGAGSDRRLPFDLDERYPTPGNRNPFRVRDRNAVREEMATRRAPIELLPEQGASQP